MNAVLVADDDEKYRELLELTLEDECGVERVRGFRAGAPLLQHLATGGTEPPALVLLDLHMPDASGIDLMREIRRLAPQVPVAFLSGAARREEREACLEAGAFAFFRKPVAYHELIRLLQDLLQAVRGTAAGPSPT